MGRMIEVEYLAGMVNKEEAMKREGWGLWVMGGTGVEGVVRVGCGYSAGVWGGKRNGFGNGMKEVEKVRLVWEVVGMM